MNYLSQGSFKSENSSTSTLRPRSTRLISYADDEADANVLGTSSAPSTSKTTSPFSSRGASPLPTVGHGKSNPHNRLGGDGNHGHNRTGSDQTSGHTSPGLWDPWSSLQGIASNLLGSDTQSLVGGKVNGLPIVQFRRRAGHASEGTQATPGWGPRARDRPELATGSVEERQALVQAKKREALLSAQAHERPDSVGRYKRRGSGTNFATCGAMAEQDSDALVYIHHIQPGDTLAGVMIKYSCQPDVFRKVNRFWPNDNIQTRKHVLLPVDACAIRGRKVDDPSLSMDLLDPSLDNLTLGQTDNSRPAAGPSTAQPPTSSPMLHPLSNTPSNDMSSYTHESWVSIPNFPNPVEILRIPRRTLGYFPPARRKSNHLSAYTDVSGTSTPRTSFDMLRHPPTHAASLNASPIRRPRLTDTTSSSRHRSSSSSTATSTIPTFTSHLHGPGGVGTLRGLRTEPAQPGPAPDPLNQKFAQYFPDLAIAPPPPPPPIEDFPRLSLRPTPSRTPRVSTDSIRSTNSSLLGDMGGTIEGWARKLAVGTTHPRRPKDREREAKMGDLIELDMQSDTQHHGDEDTRENNAEPVLIGGTDATEEALLNERFPVRGRQRRTAYGGKDKGD